MSNEPPQKRFRYATYNEKLSAISVDVGKRKGMSWEKEEFGDEEQNKTPLTVELARLELHDLTIPYQDLARSIRPLSRTLPMTLLNLTPIFAKFSEFFTGLKDGHDHVNSGLDSALALLQALFETCLGETVSYVPDVVGHLVRIGALRALEPRLIERAYSTLSLVLRSISPTLLKPENIELLRASWGNVRPYLGHNNKAYIRKCVADAWAGVLRKARGEALQRLMAVLTEDETPGMEAVWTNAMKGTSQHLHSRALPIFTVLLDELSTNPTDESVATVRRVVTALVHHCSSTNTGPLVEVVLARIAPESAASSSKKKASPRFEVSTAMLDILTAFLFTRRGKRFPSTQLKPAMLKLQSLVPEIKASSGEDASTWRRAVVSSIVGTLNAGHLAEWLSPGVALIESLWNALSTSEAFAFVNMCIAFKWAGVEQFLLAHIARAALTGLKEDPLATLALLNNLAGAGFLAGGLSNVQGGKWRAALVKAIAERLESVHGLDTASLRLLGQVLKLIPHLAGEGQHFVPHLLAILDRVTKSKGKNAAGPSDAEAAQADYRDAGAWNNTHTVGRVLSCLYQLTLRAPAAVQDEITAHFKKSDTIDRFIKNWYWSREVLGHTASFVEHWAENVNIDSDTLTLLLPNLLSADSSLRLSSLRILAIASRRSDTQSAAIWDLCVAIEQSEMSLKNVREKTANIARLSRHLAAITDPTEEVAVTRNAAITYLIAQLKVNFRPVWAETVTALTTLAQTDAERIWAIVWEEIQKTISCDKAVLPDLGVTNPEWTTQRVAADSEEGDDNEDLEFRCTGLAKGRAAVTRAWAENNDTTKLDVSEIQAQISSDRLDVLSYESQLLAVLTATPSLAEKHTRLVVPVVLAIAGTESNDDLFLSHLSTRQLQNRTSNFLELLAKFVNPKAAFRSSDLHALYLTLLSKGESKVQIVALKCLMTYKSPSLTPYAERLRNLLDESKFRDELAHLDLGIDSEVIEPQHRQEFMDVAIRVLYGIMMSRRARSSTAQGQGARKQAVLTSLAGVQSAELKTLVDLMLEPFSIPDALDIANLDSVTITAPGRQQLGYLTFLQDVLKYLAPQSVEYWPLLIGTTLVFVRQAQQGIDEEKEKEEELEVEEDEDDNEDVEKGAAPLRSIRSTGLKRIVQFLKSNVIDYDFTPFLPAMFKDVISPRLAKLEVENTQAPSGTLDLIAALASSPDTAMTLTTFDDRTLPKTFACMTAVKVKPAVILRVFDVIDSLLDEEETVQSVLLPHIRPLLDNIIELVGSLRANANDEIMRRLLAILSRLSAVVTDGTQAQQLAGLLAPMLRQPGRQVSEKAKVNILVTLQRLYSISPEFKDPSSKFFSQNYDLISNLFQSLYLPTSRRALVTALQTFAEADPSVVDTITLVSELNAYRVKRMDEPDFDKRLDAFAKINEAEDEDLPKTARQWLPILRSALFFIQEPEELSIRSNAGTLLRRFISIASAEEGPLVDMLQVVILPSLRRVLLSKIELVRNEVLLVLSHAVKTSELPVLVEMRPLVGDDTDDETNIFINIAHIQVHRRARAVRRLRETIAEPETNIRENTLSTVWMPILEHIINGATDVTDHHFINEAIITIGAIAGQLKWGRYNALLGRFLRVGKAVSAQQKFYIRCVSAVIDNFHFDLKGDARVGEIEEEEVEELAGGSDKTLESDKTDSDKTLADSETTLAEVPVNPTDRITEIVLTRLLPTLIAFVNTKSDTEDTVRIPVSVGIVKLAAQLPSESSENEILRVVTIVSQILRSKDQDTRDIARDTIGKIAVFLGPDWLVRVLRELRTALQRGPQKHILAVTTHSILVHATTEAADRFNNLDQSVTEAVEIAAEVIWGESGRDVTTEGFKTKMREVRGAASRGNDIFQLISRLLSPAKLNAVLAPVREIMHVSQAVKTMQLVDEVLRRIALGLNANAMLGPQDILSLNFSLINGNSRHLRPKKKEVKAAKTNADRFTVQLKRKNDEDEDVYAQNAYKFVTFGLELFVTAFRRGKFDFDNVDILARLGPLVNAIGNTLYSPKSEILVLGLKATAAIAKCPVPQVDAALPAFVTNIFKIIKNAGGTAESEVAQTALKTLAVLLRDCKAAQVSDSQLKYLIEVIGPDIEDHERQSAIFTVLRAVVARRFVVPEIYDLMERVSSIMVTSQSTHVQELCRGVLMQFLLDYPQGTGRLKSQMTFLARNLDYVFESGRVSVMEVLAAVFKKFSAELLQEYADLFFVALVAVVANDDSEKCRNMAGALLQSLFTSVEEVQQARTIGVLKAWIEGDDEALAAAALTVFGLLCEAENAPADLFREVPSVIGPVLRQSAATLSKAEATDEWVYLDHARPQAALTVASKALQHAGVADSLKWPDVVTLLLFPHQWVRFGAARALAVLFAIRPSGGEATDAITLLGDDALLDIARKSCILLGGSKGSEGEDVVVDAKLADQLVKLLWNISKFWIASEPHGKPEEGAEGADEEAEDDNSGEQEEPHSRPLAWLMSRMSFLARRLVIHRPNANDTLPGQPLEWTGPIMSILRFFAGVFEALNRTQARGFLMHVLSPIYRILDDNGDLVGLDGAGGIEDLRQLATEVRDFVQSKVGTTEFSRTWERVRRRVTDKRAGRREARARLAVADPKAWAVRQEKRSQNKKESKKRKVHAFMDGKGRANKKRG